MSKSQGLCGCGGSNTHHTIEESCWCRSCLKMPEERRCKAFDPVGRVVKVDDPKVRVGHAHPATAHAAAEKALPRSGSRRRSIYDWVAKKHGCTDDELEFLMGWSHQTVSAARNSLMEDGLVVDSGERRNTRHGNPAIVWVAVR